MRPEALFLTVIAVFGIVVIVHSSVTGSAVSQPWNIFVPNALDIRDLVIPSVGSAFERPVEERPAMPGAAPGQEWLVPQSVELYVDSIMVPEMDAYDFIPLSEDKMRTFSGKFGPYTENYNEYLYVELCSFVLSQPEMFACEKIKDLNYANNFLSFARGYAHDEFIAGLAMRNFGVYYSVKSTEFGPLAKSNSARINLV